MRPLLEKIRHSLERDAELPATERLARGLRYLVASSTAPLYLRGCDRVGERARTIGRPQVANAGRIEIGDDLVLNSTFSPCELSTGPGGELHLGHGVAVNYGTVLSAQACVRLGDRVSLGPYCIVSDGDASEGGEARPIDIAEGVWLAGRVTVRPGARIGAGSVITAGSVVEGEIPAGVVAGGIPARVVRRLEGAGAPAPEAAAPAPQPAPMPEPAMRGLLVSDFTIGPLAQRLRDGREGPSLEAEVAPFDQVVPTLLQPPPEGHADFAVVWTRPERALPAFARVLAGEAVGEAELLEEVAAHARHVAAAAKGYRFVVVPTWTRPAWERGLGMIDTREGGVARALAAANLKLMDTLGKTKNVSVLDAQRWLAGAGRQASSPRPWYLGKIPFHEDVFAEAARDIKAAARGLLGQARKLVVVDLDDTLWGGIVGDQGWQNLRLGGHDALGESFVDFQRALKALTRRGVVLAMVSKNEESVALEAIRSHPEMVLREGDFVGWRINWQDKARNVADLAAELNLGLQSVVFLDDNPVERARVREALPEVLVPEWPEDKMLYRQALESLRCFDTPSISKEDAERTRLYASERQREQLRKDVGSLDDWLHSLGLTVVVEPLSPTNLTRAAQLLNKTNQMNLSTRRLTEAELSAWAQAPGKAFWTISVSDKFGDAGLTGLLGLEEADGALRVVDYVLSCRVMGRRVEETLLHLAVGEARRRGLPRVVADYLKTAKNKPCLDFWARSGFAREGERFAWDASVDFPRPAPVRLEWHR